MKEKHTTFDTDGNGCRVIQTSSSLMASNVGHKLFETVLTEAVPSETGATSWDRGVDSSRRWWGVRSCWCWQKNNLAGCLAHSPFVQGRQGSKGRVQPLWSPMATSPNIFAYLQEKERQKVFTIGI